MSDMVSVHLSVAEKGTRLIVTPGGADTGAVSRLRVSFRATFRGHDACIWLPATRSYSLPGHLRARLMDWIDGHLRDAEVNWPEQEARLRAEAAREVG